MAISTYAELQTAVARWLGQRTDLSTYIVDFIALAEAEFNRSLRLTGQITRVDQAVSTRWTDISGLAAPIAEMKTVSVTTGGVRYALEYISPDYSQDMYSTGKPVYYTRVGNELGVLPPPDTTYTLELIYWRTIPALASTDPNFLLTLAPDLYLYAAVRHGAEFVMDDALLARVTPLYERALLQVQADDQRRATGGTGMMVRAA